MDIDAEFRVVTVVYKVPPPGLDFGLDESMRVVYMEPSAFLGHLFCVNDQVLFVNGVSPGSPTEAMALMEKREGEIVVSVLRSEHVEPIPRDRSKTVNLERRRGYCYFVAKLKTTETNKKLGLSVRQVNNNIYVAQVANDGIAFGVLLPGDFILDVDGTRGHNMSVPALKKHITAKLMANGECSMIVERAENYDTRVMTLNALKLKPMPKKTDPDMPTDASAIGSKQAEFHYRNNRQTPTQANLKPCLKGAKPPEKEKEKEVKKPPKKPAKKKKDNTVTVSKTVDSVTTTVDDETTGGGNNSKTTALTTCAATTEVNTVTGATTEETEQQPSSNGAAAPPPAPAPLNRKVSWSSNDPEVQLIAMDHEAGVPLQKVAERKRQSNAASSSNSSAMGAPKSISGVSKSAPPKVVSARQKKSTGAASAQPPTSPPKRLKGKAPPDSRVGRINVNEKRCVTSQRRTPAASAKQKPTGTKRKKKK
uniref:PDZ domain-containing protein n=1 Tax=Panagrellus redivivus TaxID=6233 RepID=A0A7E4W093_PANRE